jgi:sugar-specific transcriptional regulator TrmB
MIQDDDTLTRTLLKLGLTFLQAKIYLSLLKFQEAGVKKISVTSNVARPDVYRVLPALEKIGLVEKIIAKPTQYKATPIKEGCNILLQTKTDEYTIMHKNAMDLIKNYEKKDEITLHDATSEQFSLITSKALLLKKFEIEDSSAESSIDVIGDWNLVRNMIFRHLQIYEKALKKGVKIRTVTEKLEFNESADNFLLKFKDNPLLEIRHLDAPIPIKTAIYDSKKANMCVRTTDDGEMVPSLWSDNPLFVKLVKDQFENIWNKAKIWK